ncbi:hypothetical protein AB0O31_33055 [Kitasatospora cineracea]|uniref:hypothetical protein n=1 Tax=Kitasatospora cineracea TaxID=88074 RepID=UPI003412825A
MQYTVSASALLAIIIFLRLRRRTEARSRFDETVTVVSAVTLGVLIAATPLGNALSSIVASFAAATH